MTKPTLQEIANMPFPASRDTVREHFNPVWKEEHEDGAVLNCYVFDVTYSYRTEEAETIEIEAYSLEDAEDKIDSKIEETCLADFEIEGFSLISSEPVEG